MRKLDRHGIKRRPKHADGLRYVAIEQLEIGQETIVQTKSGESPKFVRGRLGDWVSGSNSFRSFLMKHGETRKPFLTK
jgi:hypothetical protein